VASSSLWAILPVKPFDDAKSRLRPVLDAAQRRRLARTLMLHSLRTLLACEAIDRVLVVSADAEALALASGHGAATLTEAETGLNPALEQANRHAKAGSATRLLVLAGDLPLVTAHDIEALIEAHGAAISADRRHQGTNALILPPDAFQFSFGDSSFQRHRDLALAAGIMLPEVDLPGLAFDVDLPEDWTDLLALGWELPAEPQPSRSGV
jgi:2-phospho-L-lactate guanylyltransferase